MPPATIVFDLDGTLADTAPDLLAVLNDVLAGEGVSPLDYDEARALVGAGVRALIERGFAAKGEVLAAERLDALFASYLRLYEPRSTERSTLFPGVVAALDALRRKGHRLAVCTNKLEYLSRTMLENFGIAPKFDALGGRDTFPFFKPDPRHLTLTVEAAGGDPGRAIMVGDSRTDVATAKAAGLPVICVPFGYTEVPVEDLDPDRIIAHFDELAGAVEAIEATTFRR